jgi:L-rhamnose mutarotase
LQSISGKKKKKKDMAENTLYDGIAKQLANCGLCNYYIFILAPKKETLKMNEICSSASSNEIKPPY